MDNSATSWFSELGMEDTFFGEQFSVVDFFDEELSAALGDNFHNSSSLEGNSYASFLNPISSSTTTLCTSVIEAPQFVVERPAKQHKPDSYNSPTIHNNPNPDGQVYPSPMNLTFGNPTMSEINPQQIIGTLNPEDDTVYEVLTSQGSFANLEEATKKLQSPKKTGGRKRPASQTYDHIIAERKRREQLSQRFVALSAIVPGLKKMDKTSVLGDAIEYLKHLQDRVKALEEKATKQKMESVVVVKKSQLLVEVEGAPDEISSPDDQSFPEIEAKVCDKTVLLRVYCKKSTWVLINILSEIEKLNLVVTNTSVAPFGRLALGITIIAEMEKDFNLTLTEVIKALWSSLKHPIEELIEPELP